MNSRILSVLFSCLVTLLAVASPANAANPFGIAYNSANNVSLYAKPTGILIAGRCNLYHANFAAARQKGAEVLAYLNAADRPDHFVCAEDQKFYMGDYGQVPLWPYPSYGQRSVYPNFRMTDMRPGSAWILHVVKHVEGMMRARKVDGIFLDVVGARPWSKLSAWTTWTQKEKDAWTDGNIDLVRRLDAKRRAVNPDFIILANNVWDRGDSRGFAGEKFVDGLILEHPVRPMSTYHKNYVARPFSNIGHRRVLVITHDATEARQWAAVPGVTHVSSQITYGTVNTPPVPFSTLSDR
jgi:hypothetical protein